jgi:hypothetical protein
MNMSINIPNSNLDAVDNALNRLADLLPLLFWYDRGLQLRVEVKIANIKRRQTMTEKITASVMS